MALSEGAILPYPWFPAESNQFICMVFGSVDGGIVEVVLARSKIYPRVPDTLSGWIWLTLACGITIIGQFAGKRKTWTVETSTFR